MGQTERTRAVAEGFTRSWSLMLDSPDWWPADRQVECARLRREAGSGAVALSSNEYVEALGSSLRKWRAFRGARFDPDRVSATLRSVAPLLRRWEGASILTIRAEEIEDLFRLFEAVRGIKPTRRKWVVTSKTLHHLLPDLIVPMDNQMTAPFLGRGHFRRRSSRPSSSSRTRRSSIFRGIADTASEQGVSEPRRAKYLTGSRGPSSRIAASDWRG